MRKLGEFDEVMANTVELIDRPYYDKEMFKDMEAVYGLKD